MNDEPDYRLYTSEEAAMRIGHITASTLDRLATAREVECTFIGRRILWTDAQLRAAVAHCRRGPAAPGEPHTRAAAPAAAATRATRSSRTTAPMHSPAGAVAPITAKPGRRYQQAGR